MEIKRNVQSHAEPQQIAKVASAFRAALRLRAVPLDAKESVGVPWRAA